MLPVYKLFAEPWASSCDFSDEAALALYHYESKGEGNLAIDVFNKTHNGFMVGKKWLNVQVSSWIQDCSLWVIKEDSPEPVENRPYEGWYTVLHRLYADPKFPHWWLDEVFAKVIEEKKQVYKDDFDDSYKETICTK